MTKILHIIDRLSGAGPTRSAIAAAKYLSSLGYSYQHRLITLQSVAYPLALILAKKAGITVLRKPARNIVLQEIENADIVTIHFWNNPEMYQFLRSELPKMRVLIWFKILGDRPPQIITPELVDYTDVALPTSYRTLELPVFQTASDSVEQTEVIYGMADFERLADLQPQPHDNFNVGYIGTVNFSKMHPNYISMCAEINLPDIRFIICGGGIEKQLKQQVEQLGISERFDFRGYVELIKPVLQILDVFGYPLCEDTYATSEKSLQEAMYAGIPSVVFPYGGVKYLVRDGETGLVVHSDKEYQQAIEYLYHHPQERTRLGLNAQKYARENFDSHKIARQLHLVMQKLLDIPKSKHCWGDFKQKQAIELSPAQLFVQSLGNTAEQFTISMTSKNISELSIAERAIAQSSPLLTGGEGGIFQYRNFYPEDPYLRLWSGLLLLEQQKYSKALREFQTVVSLGLEQWRVEPYIEKVTKQLTDK